jgi:hypothetical protein
MSRMAESGWVTGGVVLALIVWVVTNAAEGLARPHGALEPGSQTGDTPEHLELSFRDVMRQQGPAREKIEYESSRRVRWRYADFDVLFVNGRARVGAGVALRGGAGAAVAPSMPPSRSAGLQIVSPEAERIFNEILKELPSGPDEPAEAGFPLPGGGSPSRALGLVYPAPGIELSPQM